MKSNDEKIREIDAKIQEKLKAIAELDAKLSGITLEKSGFGKRTSMYRDTESLDPKKFPRLSRN